jgi:DNA-binding HxlR family transcriptional regulator
VPPRAWSGYGRFCPLARALDVVGERWTLVIVQELLKRPSRYSDLVQRLPGIGTTVLADRLRKLDEAGVVERQAAPVGEGVLYVLTDRGRGLEQALSALRQWGVEFLTDPTAVDGSDAHEFDVRYVSGIETLAAGEFGLVVGDTATTLRFADGVLQQRAGLPDKPELVVRTSSEFMNRWASGAATWDDGLASGEVELNGRRASWERWLAATGYLLSYSAREAA